MHPSDFDHRKSNKSVRCNDCRNIIPEGYYCFVGMLRTPSVGVYICPACHNAMVREQWQIAETKRLRREDERSRAEANKRAKRARAAAEHAAKQASIAKAARRRKQSIANLKRKGTATQRKPVPAGPSTLRGSYGLREGFLNAMAKD